MEKDCDIGELVVLETKQAGYNSATYFVGFPVTHVKLDINGYKYLKKFNPLKYGEDEIDYGH